MAGYLDPQEVAANSKQLNELRGEVSTDPLKLSPEVLQTFIAIANNAKSERLLNQGEPDMYMPPVAIEIADQEPGSASIMIPHPLPFNYQGVRLGIFPEVTFIVAIKRAGSHEDLPGTIAVIVSTAENSAISNYEDLKIGGYDLSTGRSLEFAHWDEVEVASQKQNFFELLKKRRNQSLKKELAVA